MDSKQNSQMIRGLIIYDESLKDIDSYELTRILANLLFIADVYYLIS